MFGKRRGGDDYGMQRKERREEAREDGKEARKERKEISYHRQAMADALEVVHLQNVGTWHR